MQIRLERAKSIGRQIGINDDKGIRLAIFLVLIIVSATAIGYFAYAAFAPKPEPYSTIYLLDNQKTASNYPQTLVANQNSTFNVWVAVENHRGETTEFQVYTKITPNLSTFPVAAPVINSTIISLADGKTWESQQSITENQIGSYSVVFELYRYNTYKSEYEFTSNACVLNIEVIS
jgi:uncharacterized membrane protein